MAINQTTQNGENNMTTEIKQFKVGQELSTRSIGDNDCVFTATVIKRTAKTITIKMMGELKTRRVKIYENAEMIHPLGTYSMAPTFRA